MRDVSEKYLEKATNEYKKLLKVAHWCIMKQLSTVCKKENMKA